MAYDEKLAERIHAAVRGWRGLSTRRMFGSIGWMLDGNICAGIWKDSLIVRCGPDEWPRLLREPHVAEFDITGRSMKGWLMVRPTGIADARTLEEWLRRSHDFVRTLPKKAATQKKKAPTKRAATRARRT
jgi:TfoX/Sxy family transcriptional regulator of competence genes